MDFSDHATRQEELMRELALRKATNHPPALMATGECHWCWDCVPPGHRFCDKDCRDMFDKQARIDAINGRRVP